MAAIVGSAVKFVVVERMRRSDTNRLNSALSARINDVPKKARRFTDLGLEQYFRMIHPKGRFILCWEPENPTKFKNLSTAFDVNLLALYLHSIASC